MQPAACSHDAANGGLTATTAPRQPSQPRAEAPTPPSTHLAAEGAGLELVELKGLRRALERAHLGALIWWGGWGWGRVWGEGRGVLGVRSSAIEQRCFAASSDHIHTATPLPESKPSHTIPSQPSTSTPRRAAHDSLTLRPATRTTP